MELPTTCPSSTSIEGDRPQISKHVHIRSCIATSLAHLAAKGFHKTQRPQYLKVCLVSELILFHKKRRHPPSLILYTTFIGSCFQVLLPQKRICSVHRLCTCQKLCHVHFIDHGDIPLWFEPRSLTNSSARRSSTQIKLQQPKPIEISSCLCQPRGIVVAEISKRQTRSSCRCHGRQRHNKEALVSSVARAPKARRRIPSHKADSASSSSKQCIEQ